MATADSSDSAPASADDAETARLTELLYNELRRIAAGYLRAEDPGHTLQPTALVHEAFLRLSAKHVHWQNRTHFLAIAANTMRRILVDHARRRSAAKRYGGILVTMDEIGDETGGDDRAMDLLALGDGRGCRNDLPITASFSAR